MRDLLSYARIRPAVLQVELHPFLTQEKLEIALRHHRTPAQIVLRWGVQRGTAVVPKTTRLDRLEENLALFDFQLSDSEMKTLSSMNRNRRFNDPGDFCEAAFGRFFPIYE